ncbi:MAG: hypothetical protein QF903_09935 [Planctomycetota bacterium]|jgi:hypothetical protein|nr:hypothetical protein [Planctomycetota bacterium]MDP6761995.1 hypothetical protein [Planctomycetota bacterium]MDP6989785.1 hypothetical protein [Planctomycetota bacterium]
MTSTTEPTSLRRASWPVLCLIVLCACRSSDSAEEIDGDVAWLVSHGQFAEAVTQAQSAWVRDPADPAAEALYRGAFVAQLLDQARAASFDNEDELSLQILSRALEIDPEHEAVLAWEAKTRLKIAERWLEIGRESHADGNLAAAQQAYVQALEFEPEHPTVLRNLGRVTLQANYRDGRGTGYYNEGVRALSDYWLEQARRGFAASEKFQPANTRAVRRQDQVELMLADQRLAIGMNFESKGLFAAAANEYLWALALDPESEEAAEGKERAGREARAKRLLSESQMLIFRNEVEGARELLEEAMELSEAQDEQIAEMLASIDERSLDVLYSRAIDLERDQLFEEAIAAYGVLLEATDYHKDAVARRDTLQEYIVLAADYYERAMAADAPEEKLESLRAIAQFWTDYRDVQDLLSALGADR